MRNQGTSEEGMSAREGVWHMTPTKFFFFLFFFYKDRN